MDGSMVFIESISKTKTSQNGIACLCVLTSGDAFLYFISVCVMQFMVYYIIYDICLLSLINIRSGGLYYGT